MKSGSCNNYIKLDSWAKLLNNPPASLVQNYYECYPFFVDSILNAIGVASGNTSIAILVLLFVCVPTVIFFRALLKVVPMEQEYSQKDKMRTLDSLATLILRARDNDFDGIRLEHNPIIDITEELIDAVGSSNEAIVAESGKFTEDIIRSGNELVRNRQLLGKLLIYKNRRKNLHVKSSMDTINFSPNRRQHKYHFVEDSPMKTKMTHKHDAHVDVEQPAVDSNVKLRLRVMNNFNQSIPDIDEGTSLKSPYISTDLRMLVNGLVYYFTNSIRSQSKRDNRRNQNITSLSDKPLYISDSDYAKGCILSKLLLEVNVNDMLNSEDTVLFTSLANALCMHASLDSETSSQRRSMQEIAEKHADQYAYQIGDKVFMYSTLIAYSMTFMENG